MPDGVILGTLLKHIRPNYAPMGEQFRFWHLKEIRDHSLAELVTSMLLLALACPNFDYAAAPSSQRELFMEAMEKDISSDLFKPYVPCLRRLLFNLWNGKGN